MAKVLGIGGVFFKSSDPAALSRWYREHLGVDVQPWGGAQFLFARRDKADRGGDAEHEGALRRRPLPAQRLDLAEVRKSPPALRKHLLGKILDVLLGNRDRDRDVVRRRDRDVHADEQLERAERDRRRA